MAYGTKYQFTFQSQNGEEFRIIIEKDGHSGDVIHRALGRAPVLKRERNGHVCGTSLEIYAECQVDGEFAEFYTSDPHLFRVHVVSQLTNRWLFYGFISPELYAEPDIAPPYDVQITATDGLGELRRYLYEPLGAQTLDTVLDTMLAKTGLRTSYRHNNNTLTAGGSSTVPAADFFDLAVVNMDHLAGKSCYDVLTSILDSIHADLFQSIDEGVINLWQIIRETDVESGTAVTIRRDPDGVDTTVVPQAFGSMQSRDWWPVGQLTTQVKPACKRLTVISDAHYKDGLVNGGMTSDAGWQKSSASYSSSLGAYQITAQNGYISQTLTFAEQVRRRLKLAINLRQYRPTASAASAAGAASIQIVADLRNYGGTGTRYLTKNSNDEYVWSSTAGSLTVDLPAPVYNEGEAGCTTFEVEIPLFFTGSRNYAMASSLTVKVIRNSSNIPLLVHNASLTFEEQIAGYRDVFSIDNGARDEADDVNSVFLPTGQGFYNTPVEFMYGVLQSFGSSGYISVFDQVGTDYAKSCVIPRIRKTGVLNVPAGGLMPFVMRDSNGDNYLVQTAEWDLLNCEMTVEILSLPASSVTITGQDVTEVVYKGGTASSGGSSSSGGGGGGTGGGTVTSVGLSMPSGFSVSGSPVTGSGTIQVSLDNTLVIPTKVEQNTWNAAALLAHEHSNKAILDTINGDVAEIVMQLPTQMLHVVPSVKRFCRQANSTSSNQDAPYFFVRHPLLEVGLPVEVCLMVYRKRNGNGGSRKAHRKGWFLACGYGHAASAAYAEELVPDHGSVAVKVKDLLDGIARTYCQIYGAVQSQDYDDWLYWVSQLGPDFTAFGFSGMPDPPRTKSKIHFGLAIRMENPDFWNLVDTQRTLYDDTGSIEGIPRYLYSRVAPLTARMYKEAKGGQPRGGVVFDLI